MPNSSPAESLAKRRADFEHIEESGNIGEGHSVAIIREQLVRRIAELKAVVRRTRVGDEM